MLPCCQSRSNKRHDLVAGGGIERAGRLIGQQNGRIVHQGPRYRHALSLAARQLIRPVIHARFQIHRAQRRFGAFQPLFLGNTGINQGQLDIVQRRKRAPAD